MEDQKTIDVLNNLIQINNNRIEGYEIAARETEEAELKDLFGEFITTSQNCNSELVSEIILLNGAPTDDGTITGKFFQIWMDVKNAFTNNDRESIISSCEYGEDMAKISYEKTLENDAEYLSARQLIMIQDQLAMLNEDHDKVKEMRDIIV